MIPTYSKEYIGEIPFEIKAINLDNPFLKSPHLHRHEFYELVFISKGQGWHHIDFERHKVEENQLFFITRGQVHMLEVSQVDGLYITFDESFLTQHLVDFSFTDFSFFYSHEHPQVISLSKEQEIEEIFNQLNNLFSKKDFGFEALIRSNLVILLFTLEKMFRKTNQLDQSKKLNNLVLQFKKFIDINTGSRFVKDYAGLLHVTPNHLNEVVKEATGRTAGSFLRERALLEAKRMLLQPNLSIAQIAFHLHFKEPAHFSNFFKRYEGVTPYQFRENIKKQYVQNDSD